MSNVKKEDIIAAIKECAQNLGRAPKDAELLNHFPAAKMGAIRKYLGTYTLAHRKAGWIAWRGLSGRHGRAVPRLGADCAQHEKASDDDGIRAPEQVQRASADGAVQEEGADAARYA